MRLIRENLLLQFIIVSVIAFVILGLLLSIVMTRRLNDFVIEESIRDAQDVAQHRLAGNVTPADFAGPMSPQRLAAFDEFIRKQVVSSSTARVKLWAPDGTVTYSTDPAQVGQSYPIKEELAQALKGEVAAEISVPQAAENERERFLGTLVEVYVPVELPGAPGVAGAFEVYQFYAPIAEIINGVKRFALLTLALTFIALFLALVTIVGRGWRQIRQGQELLNNRFRELQGLNNLFRIYLDRGYEVTARFRELRRRAEAELSSGEAHHGLLAEVAQFEEEFALAYPTSSPLRGGGK